jgi:hypothetical protein
METVQGREQLLDMKVGNMSFREMTAIGFNQYIMKKLSGLRTYNPRVQELTMVCNVVLPSRQLSEEIKLERLNKLKELGVELP